MRACLALALLLQPAFGQTPPVLDAAFFGSERRLVLKELTERVRAQKPEDAKCLPECARGYLGALNRPKAEEALKLAEKLEPKDGEVLRLIGYAWLKGGYKSEALTAYELIFARDPGNKDALQQAGIDLAEVGQTAEAKRFMDAYEALEEDDWKAFAAFGRALLVGGHRKAAAPWFAKAVAHRSGKHDVLLEILRAFADTQSVL